MIPPDPNCIDSATCTRQVPGDRPVDLPGEEGATTDDPCDLTNLQTKDIFTAYCVRCHGAPGDANAPFHNILTWKGMDNLIAQPSTMKDGLGNALKLIVPGSPDKSRLYQRMALIGDMPKKPDNPALDGPRPTISDFSVIYTWIKSCTGDPVDTGTGGAPPTGTAGSGSGGSSGAGTAGSGTGGA